MLLMFILFSLDFLSPCLKSEIRDAFREEFFTEDNPGCPLWDDVFMVYIKDLERGLSFYSLQWSMCIEKFGH